MIFIAKHREKNSFKVVTDLGELSAEIFRTHVLFQAEEISPAQFQELLKRRKIDQLTAELKNLGVDLSAGPAKIQAPRDGQAYQEPPIHQLPQDSVILNETPAVPMSKVSNPAGGLYTMEDIKNIYEVFKARVEHDIPEISFSNYDEYGIKLAVIEIRHDLPRILPNGVPVIQTTT